eukprot:CAMPEP_0206275010 /NCGR_PEP_ID=MMETSP0047_2-20121206/35482_1 /ASSEMBLY_ACC=CAM_ASM_000192 /TAXON_ID=195065 /ORGANISM="Chroomonas mesostigmatica_cf, Strain CCMP1168" /LENGTH=56 /DNA_ID=CAMNT_0053704307 /DNA_START=73 /DNA_END=240 /DNA_ORIENTATION=-
MVPAAGPAVAHAGSVTVTVMRDDVVVDVAARIDLTVAVAPHTVTATWLVAEMADAA